jgi:hypothetical protein
MLKRFTYKDYLKNMSVNYPKQEPLLEKVWIEYGKSKIKQLKVKRILGIKRNA